MTKLNQVSGVENAVRFAEQELVKEKGPYIELVRAPAAHSASSASFLNSLDYDQRVIDAVTSELFSGDATGRLYQHQAETIEAIETTDQDTILSVPTATGKTESFFLPILNHCLTSDKPGLKSIILYPMKTLTVDQLNRFLTYLNEVNEDQPPEERVSIGIWDGDTPHDVGSRDYEIEAGSFIRGLECPQTGEKLRVLSTNTVGTDRHTYSWVKVTRESIKQGVDILLTNPEAIDHMFVNDSAETRHVLGSRPSEHPVEHIVYDEAHVWSGISGAGISLLTERLKHFYAEHDPQVTMVSATVDNPSELASALTGSQEKEVNAVNFTGRTLPDKGDFDFRRLEPCTLDEIAEVVVRVVEADPSKSLVDDTKPQLRNAVRTLTSIGLLDEEGDQLIVDSRHRDWLIHVVDKTFRALIRHGKYNDRDEVLHSKDGVADITDALLDEGGYDTPWFDFVTEEVPEILEVASWFDTDTTGSVGFKAYDDLLSELCEASVEHPEQILTTVLAFGRLAGIVTEKYHSFLKPPLKVYWCRDCRIVSRTDSCQECDQEIVQMKFCRRCHYPYFAAEATADEEAQFVPVEIEHPVDACPGCDKYLNLTDVGVPTPTLLSFMLTEICRTAPSRKTLVFSDSHAAAESVGSEIMNTEYGLMAETLYVKTLLEHDGVVDNYEAFQTVAEQLREAYYEPLYQNDVDEDSETYNLLRQMRSEITSKAMLHNCRHLFDAAIVTQEPLYDAAGSDTEYLIIGHELFSLFASGTPSFDRETVSIDGLTREKICERLSNRLTYSYETVELCVDELLEGFLADKAIQERSWEDVRHDINNAGIDSERADLVFDYIEAQRDTLNEIKVYNRSFESGVFTRISKEDRSDLRLLPRVAYCSECYSAHPVPDGETIDTCVSCGEPVEVYNRFEIDSNGTYSGQGYADIETEWEWPLDHWAYEISRPLNDPDGPQFITVGIHKGNIPPTLRGAIEESFRKDDPGVNIVSATPTMELGVDIGSLETVTQVGMPPTLTNYVQRSGRTGRTRGSSSLVMTVVRGDHPVDNHYYANLEGFFKEFEPVRVPDAYDFDEVLAGHVVTVVTAYLAQNPHESNIFEKIYSLQESNTDVESYVSNVSERLEVLCDFIDEEMKSELRSYLHEIFGGRGVEIFEEVFFGDGQLSIRHRTDRTFTQLATMSGSSETNKRLSKRHNRLDSWLSLLGYLANYRDFGQRFPVKFSGRFESIEFESTGRLYDMFPGEENDVGSVLTLSGTKYIVSDVHGTTTPLTEVAICANEDCARPYQAYQTSNESCPHCEEDLTNTDIHGIGSVECRTARGGEKGYNTRGIMTTHVSKPDGERALKDSATIFDLDCTIRRGEFTVTDFVYAFERGHSQSPNRETIRSEALIERNKSTDNSGASWRDRLDNVTEETYAPVGQRYHTQGIELQFSREAINERLTQTGLDEIPWPQILASLEQSLTKAVAVVAEADQQDFRVKTTLTDDAVELLIVDSRQGGNGITWQVAQELTGELPTTITKVSNCTNCADFCEECLLLARTPPSYLENDLLNKHTLRAIVRKSEEVSDD
jgi:ATP-dependent helicase YprA (DUF1998 family)